MKPVLIVIGLIFLVFAVVQLFALYSQRGIETYGYTVLDSYDTFEIRRYEATLFSAVELPLNGYKEASRQGFSLLAGYIFGNNDKNQNIAMTAPVAMTLSDTTTMMFMLPKTMQNTTLPKPNDAAITFKREPAKTVAAITFKGWANDSKIADYKQQLIAALAAKGIAHSNRFYFFGYNAPYEVFNRNNEIIVEL